VNLTLELKAITGTNSAIMVKEEFTDEKHETIKSAVTFIGWAFIVFVRDVVRLSCDRIYFIVFD
jgi:hypothetical protein